MKAKEARKWTIANNTEKDYAPSSVTWIIEKIEEGIEKSCKQGKWKLTMTFASYYSKKGLIKEVIEHFKREGYSISYYLGCYHVSWKDNVWYRIKEFFVFVKDKSLFVFVSWIIIMLLMAFNLLRLLF